MSLEDHLEKVIWQAHYFDNEFVVWFKGPDDLEFLEIFKDERQMNAGKRFWNNFDPKYRTYRVYDVDYWIGVDSPAEV